MQTQLTKRLEREALPFLVLTVTLYLLVVTVQSFVVPQWHYIGELRSDVARYQKLVVEENGREGIKEQINTKHAALLARLEVLTSGMSDPEDLSSLLKVIFDKAWQAGVRIDKAQPQEEIAGESYSHYPIVLEMNATYHSLGVFVSSLEMLPHVLRIDRLAVTAKDAGNLNVKILVTCFLEGGSM